MKSKRSGKTAEKHADAIIAELYPGGVIQRAVKSAVWIFDKKTQERRPITNNEDLFDCLDRLILMPTGAVGIQITTHGNTGAASDRRKKVRTRIAEPLISAPDPARGILPSVVHLATWLDLQVWAWEDRTAMRRWRWAWDEATWHRSADAESPLLQRHLARVSY